MQIEIELKNDGKLAELEKKLADFRPAWKSIHAFMLKTILYQFDAMKGDLGSGRTLRGVRWKYFKYQYIRKTDGVTVPAWGGVPLIRKSWKYPRAKLVKGKLRSKQRGSKKRIKKGDSIMQNTGKMRSGILQKIRMTKYKITMRSAGDQKKIGFQNRLRPFLFFEIPHDVDKIKEYVIKYLEGDNGKRK